MLSNLYAVVACACTFEKKPFFLPRLKHLLQKYVPKVVTLLSNWVLAASMPKEITVHSLPKFILDISNFKAIHSYYKVRKSYLRCFLSINQQHKPVKVWWILIFRYFTKNRSLQQIETVFCGLKNVKNKRETIEFKYRL